MPEQADDVNRWLKCRAVLHNHSQPQATKCSHEATVYGSM